MRTVPQKLYSFSRSPNWMFGLPSVWTAPAGGGCDQGHDRRLQCQRFICLGLLAVLTDMKIRITMNGKAIDAQEAARDLLHPDKLAERMLQQKAAGVVCDDHPIQCRHLHIKVASGKVELEGICCDAFRQKVLAAMQAVA